MMRATTVTCLVFTDLDATLLDHDDYDWSPAVPALTTLAERGIPVCLVTSKTVAEVTALRHLLGNIHPFAAENGAVVAVPRGYFDGDAVTVDTPLVTTVLGTPRHALRKLAMQLRVAHDFRYTGFGDMDTAAIAAATHLDSDAAALASQREASEPLLWQDTDDAFTEFEKRVAAAGYSTRAGGRFVHVLGRANKGDAVTWLRERFAAAYGPNRAVALGDSANDVDMLTAADIGYWVARPDGRYQYPASGTIRHAGGIGPAGWATAIRALIANDEI